MREKYCTVFASSILRNRRQAAGESTISGLLQPYILYVYMSLYYTGTIQTKLFVRYYCLVSLTDSTVQSSKLESTIHKPTRTGQPVSPAPRHADYGPARELESRGSMDYCDDYT